MTDTPLVPDGSLIPVTPPVALGPSPVALVAPDATSGAPPSTSGGQQPAADEGGVMSLVDHLSELRRRLAISILAVVVGAVLGFILAPNLIRIVKAPYGDQPLLLLNPGEGFMINLKIAIVVGIVVAMPVILFQLWRFVSPGLTREERRIARPWVPLALVFFVIGVVVAYFILPFAIAFLSSFGTGDLKNAWTADGYFGFVAMMMLAFGLVMEYPMLLVLLSKVGIISSARLRSSRRIVILIIAIVATVVTPGGDPFSPTILGVTMYVLYEFSIVLVRVGGR
jgi:sec-independent protein translocase protein TatC